ncbi:MAG: hypothetical protein CENE_03476 [Candidatus Celerinatantimonas neptuna]|nr:MAG: hypothetical protein CENE_03476 [Candidatus Celerinatantimonas neptuna]
MSRNALKDDAGFRLKLKEVSGWIQLHLFCGLTVMSLFKVCHPVVLYRIH